MKTIVAFTGYASCGKDSFCRSMKSVIEREMPNKQVEIFAFAESLRHELDNFMQINFQVSCWEENRELKEKVIRPFLVAYGNAKRFYSNNQYWIERLNKKIDSSDCDIALISDLRFAESDNDEIYWLKNKQGLSFYIERYENGKQIKPPNVFEKNNCILLKKKADEVIKMNTEKSDQEFKRELDLKCTEIYKKYLYRFV